MKKFHSAVYDECYILIRTVNVMVAGKLLYLFACRILHPICVNLFSMII